MLRKILIAMLCLLPIEASAAWFFQTQVKSAGGAMTSRNRTGQRVSDGPIFRSYTTGTLGVSIQADSGFKIRSVIVNNAQVVAPQDAATSYQALVYGGTDQSVTATFIADIISVTATNPGGTVAPSSVGGIAYGYTLTTPVTFTFVPKRGYEIVDVLNVPSDPRASHTPYSPGVNQPVKVTFAAGYVFTSSVNLQAVTVNNTPAIDRILPQTATAGSGVTLAATTTNVPAGATFAWKYVSGPGNTSSVSVVNGKVVTTVEPGPAVALSGGDSAAATFTAPSLPGQYKFQVVVSSAGRPDLVALAVVNVAASGYAAAKGQCQFCHTANGVGSANLFSNWSASRHRANSISCDKCHVQAATGGHPGRVDQSVCANCHFQGDIGRHVFGISTTVCTSCHDQHSLVASGGSMQGAPHFNNVTSGNYPASYNTSRIGCDSCHATTPENAAARHQWAASGHAAYNAPPFTEYDFKTRSGCVQCHTATGFIAYSTGKVTAAWGGASDKTKELIACIACHSDVASGTPRSVKPVHPFADTPDYANQETGPSNLCFACHSGRTTGAAIQGKVGTADFTNTPFVSPHYLAAGATIYGKGGYEFSGQGYSFYSTNTHRTIGMDNSAGTGTGGPCVACHMGSAEKHSLKAAATDATGRVTAIVSSACAKCHGGSMDAVTLDAKKVSYNGALEILRAMLDDKGYAYSPAYPYFSSTNWGSGQAGADTMGAAYNYKLLAAEPGAFAHNGAYAKRLIVDSIDYLYNGRITGSIDTALAYLVGKGAITQAAADSLASYQSGSGSCGSCHGSSTGSHPAHLALQIGCASCHSATAATNATLVSGTTTHQNGTRDVVFAAGIGGGYSGINKSCSGVYCHSDGQGTYQLPVWGSGRLSCKSCHPVLRGAHAAHVGTLFDTVGFYGYTSNNSVAGSYRFGCANCHPTELASHANGRVDVTLVPQASAGSLRGKNSPAAVISGVGNSGSGIAGTSGSSVTCSASYCHSNGRVGGALAYATSPDWYNPGAYGGDRCAMCHGNAPATGAHAAHAVGIHYKNVSDANGNLIFAHGDESQSTTISCDLCHSATVTATANDNGTGCTSCHSSSPKGTPQLDRTRHLNGSLEVVFKGIRMVSKAQVRPASFGKYSSIWTRTTYKAGAGSFDTSKLPLSAGTWDATGKSCSNVACHNGGAPTWGGRLSCVDCHSNL